MAGNVGLPGAVSWLDDRGIVRAMPIAIVTGGNSGIGRATVVALAKAGYDIGLTWHDKDERAEGALQEITAHGVRAEARQVDLHEPEKGAQVIDELADALGGVDVFVSNAGYGADAPFLEIDAEQFRGVIEVNLVGAFLCGQAAARRMVEQGRGGRIINVTSVHEHVPLRGNTPYSASKHGLGGVTKVAALELAEHGILVNSVAPGQIATRMTGQEDQAPAPSEGIPLGRAGAAREIADLIVFLAGPGASYITGQSYVADGGLTLVAAEHQ
jgi:NAD(P)-dependent dehydrogenase (short-subunit alcohol dehydrogenase family)